MNNFINKKVDKKAVIFFVGISLITFLLAVNQAFEFAPGLPVLPEIHWPEISWPVLPEEPEEPEPSGPSEIKDIKKFTSEQEFMDYIKQGTEQLQYFGFGARTFERVGIDILAPMAKEEMEGIGGGEMPERISETTVQVAGIDEPDIVKTNGKEIYFSEEYYLRWPGPIILEEAILPKYESTTKVINAFPPTDLALKSEIDKAGNLLLQDNILVIFSGQNIYGYDISEPKSSEKKWEIELDNQNFLVTSRLYQGKIYLVTKQTINEYHPCPIKPLIIEGEPLEIACEDIYHPVVPIPVDATFVAMILNPASGAIEKKVSFVGSSGSSVVYMSKNAIYVTYSFYESLIKFYFDFFKEKCQDIVSAPVLGKIEKLESYDISQNAKWVEFELILENYLASLDNDEQLRINNELANRMDDYYEEHKRELEKTGLVKVDLKELDISASGNISGHPLNQFALDEYQGYLRIATTIGQMWGLRWSSGGSESANDVYVLDKDLKITGSVKNLGLTERIYSVRFIEDKGYVVTFRETDPFYVLDLSDTQNPQVKGELKIPGYSAYLHPITKDKILGIGKEDWQVKISLFDVSSPANPKELDKYILDESWSDILLTHHAFLLDEKHQIFFLPGSRGGYVFSYKDNKLSLARAVSDISSRRAIYLDDYLYIIADDKIVVLNELNWQKLNELEF